jgi:aminoglycoside phosphotransferase family enzyme/predicted kinase
MSDDQREVIAFLREPSAYGPGVGRVEVIETHVSLVFLAGERAYKLKRAVAYPYLDFSTREARRAACEAELALNRRTAPDLYLGVRAIGRGAGGGIGWIPATEAGEALDWVVVMRRFAQDQVFDALAAAGRLDAPLILALAAHIAAFHAQAERRSAQGGAAAMESVADGNVRSLRDAAAAAGFSGEAIDDLGRRTREHLAQHAALLNARRAAGKVRRVHGDLHLRNICLFEGRPILFDCLEFSEELATIDVLYDLAFLLMDLDERGLSDFANLAFNRYLDLSGEDDGIAAMPLFLSLRAAIRAHATAAALGRHALDEREVGRAEADRYFAAARGALLPQPARLVAIGGLSGSGKSTLALRLAPALGLRPGARVLRSDVIRKCLFGVAPETPLPAAAYAPEITRRVYAALGDKAAAALAAGYCAVLDAVSLQPAERAAFAALAAAAGVPFTGLWLEAPAETMTARLGARRGDASDASASVLAGQLGRDPGAVDWRRIAAGGDPDKTLAAARRALGLD